MTAVGTIVCRASSAGSSQRVYRDFILVPASPTNSTPASSNTLRIAETFTTEGRRLPFSKCETAVVFNPVLPARTDNDQSSSRRAVFAWSGEMLTCDLRQLHGGSPPAGSAITRRATRCDGATSHLSLLGRIGLVCLSRGFDDGRELLCDAWTVDLPARIALFRQNLSHILTVGA